MFVPGAPSRNVSRHPAGLQAMRRQGADHRISAWGSAPRGPIKDCVGIGPVFKLTATALCRR
jgi:hypothetical protein